MSRQKKIAIVIGAILAVYSLAGFVAVPLILQSMLPKKLAEALHRPVTIDKVRINPFSLTASVDGLVITDKNQTAPFVSFDKLLINIQAVSLFKLGLVAREVRLEKPRVHFTRTAQTEFNFSDLITGKKPESESEETKPAGEPFRFSISNIAIIDGSVVFEDKPVKEEHVLSAINFRLPRISNFQKDIDSYSTPVLTGELNKAQINVNMDAKPFENSRETKIDFSLSGLEIPYYFVYVPEKKLGFKISNGRLDIQARVSFQEKNNAPDVTVEGVIGIAGLKITGRDGSPILNLTDLKIEVAPSRPLEKQLTLASVHMDSPELSVSRNPEGTINLTTLAPEKPAETGVDASAKITPAQSTPGQNPPEKPFTIAIDEFLVDSGKISWTDRAASKTRQAGPVEMSVDGIGIKISDFSNAPDQTATYDIHALINKKAAVSAAGRVGVAPLQVQSDFEIQDIKLAWGQPYIPETVRLVINDGKFSASGHAAIATAPEGALTAAVSGKAAVDEFDSMDGLKNQPFASWRTFSVDGIEVSVNPLRISTDKILLSDFKNHLTLFTGGGSNMAAIFAEPENPTGAGQEAKAAAAADTQTPSPVIPIKIGEVLLENFNVEFIDGNIEPEFSTGLNLSELRVTGLTSEGFNAADLDANGQIDNYAPIKVNGKINPLKKDLFVDLTYSLDNLELSPLSPFSGKYIGRTIEKGKFSTSAVYKINQKVIHAENKVLLDQFTLGRKVDSPDALDLPVGLAIALLKDRSGKIKLDLPVSGRTDDPDFGIGKPLLAALKNLVIKAAASPFDLVGSIVGGGEELRYIEFNPGSAMIDDAAARKLDAIKKLLYERPILKLDISGYVDQADRDALADRKLAQKINDRLAKNGSVKDGASLDEIALPPEAYEKLLKQVYAQEVLSDPDKAKTQKPLDDPGLTPKEMESQIRSQITVSADELRQLALERTRQVKDDLLHDNHIAADRLFLLQSHPLSPVQKDKFKASRVELTLRQ